jgi:copper chaperone
MVKEVAKLDVEGMSCQHCVSSIKKAVGDLQGIDSVEVDLRGKKVTIGFDSRAVSLGTIKETIEDQGYEVK